MRKKSIWKKQASCTIQYNFCSHGDCAWGILSLLISWVLFREMIPRREHWWRSIYFTLSRHVYFSVGRLNSLTAGFYIKDGQCSSRSDCEYTQSDPIALHCPWVYKIESIIDLLADSVAIMSDCADSQNDLKLHCLHTTIDKCRQCQYKG